MDKSVTSFFPVAQRDADDHEYTHLIREIARIDLCLQRYINLHREALESHVLDDFLLDNDVISTYKNTSRDMPDWMKEATVQHEHTLFQKTDAGGRLAHLVERFNLNSFEVDVLLLGLLPHIDSRYFSLFSALQRSSQKNFPSFELTLALLRKTSFCDVDARLSLLPQSPLLKYQLVTLDKSGNSQEEGWAQCMFRTATGVYQYLTGNRYFSPELAACAEWYPQECGHFQHGPSEMLTALQVQAEAIRPVLILEGTSGGDRLGAIRAAATHMGLPVLCLDMASLPSRAEGADVVLREALREVRMREAVLVVRQAELQDEESPSLSVINWARYLPQPGVRIVMLCERQIGHILLSGVPQLVVTMTGASRREQEQLLSQSLDDEFSADVDIAAFCRRFSFTHATLPSILLEAKGYRTLRNSSDLVRSVDLNKAFRFQARKDFGRLAQRKEPKRTFDDLVVADELKKQLSEILMAAKHRDAVLDMGFAAKVGYGTGVSALFCGHSGTGKTMAAEVIAGQLGVDLIKVDLSTVVNKYIGETEKNLSRIFDLAEADAGVLFFDEADALFGKRSAVSDSKDRHANIEVAYLLQRLENYPGLVILATNNRNHLDDAFSRRFTFITRFDFPDAKIREEMWRRVWPEKVRLSDDIDFTALAKNAELTGANIRNIALMSAWLAAEEGSCCINVEHIRLALRRELEKVGRVSR